jgi:hypothetical protein
MSIAVHCSSEPPGSSGVEFRISMSFGKQLVQELSHKTDFSVLKREIMNKKQGMNWSLMVAIKSSQAGNGLRTSSPIPENVPVT